MQCLKRAAHNTILNHAFAGKTLDAQAQASSLHSRKRPRAYKGKVGVKQAPTVVEHVGM